MKALIVEQLADRNEMRLVEHPDPEAKEGEVLVKIEATALNRADLMQKSGKYPPPKGVTQILGLEMAGTVEKLGPKVKGISVGDRMYGLLSGGGYAEYCTIRADHLLKIPEEFSFEEAAAIPEVYLTAYQAAIWLGKLAKSETILIHAGASGVGTAAIQLARELRKARIITTTGSGEKCELTGSLGSDLCINYNEENFAESIQDTFGEYCVDVIIDFVGSPYWDNNLEVLAMDGRVIYLSLLGGTMIDKMNLSPILRKRLTIMGSTLRNRSDEYKAELIAAFQKNTNTLFEKGKLKPIIDSVFNWEEVEEAHTRMKNNLNAGKIVLIGM